MESITITHTYGRTDTFEIFNDFPAGYIVWNIGRGNFPFEGFVPIAKPASEPYHIDLGHLGAWKVKDEATAMKIIEAAHYVEINSYNYGLYL